MDSRVSLVQAKSLQRRVYLFIIKGIRCYQRYHQESLRKFHDQIPFYIYNVVLYGVFVSLFCVACMCRRLVHCMVCVILI